MIFDLDTNEITIKESVHSLASSIDDELLEDQCRYVLRKLEDFLPPKATKTLSLNLVKIHCLDIASKLKSGDRVGTAELIYSVVYHLTLIYEKEGN